MKKNILNLIRVTFTATIVLQLLLTANVFASERILLYSLEDSKNEIVLNEGDKMMLKQDWYGMRFEINPVQKNGARALRTVNIDAYNTALHSVNFDLEKVGEYKVYFLDYRLKNYSNAAALCFMNDSTVVFGTYTKSTKSSVHKLAVHELGHQVDFELMNDEKWAQYSQIRGITDSSVYNNSTSVYKNRPQEIFAEDFRMICGGTLAKKAAHLNRALENPRDNEQLVEFFENL